MKTVGFHPFPNILILANAWYGLTAHSQILWVSHSCSKWPPCCCPQPRWQNHLSQNCVLSATIVDLHPNSINPVPGDVSIQGWHTHTHQCPGGRSPNIADCCETLVGCEDTREGQPGGAPDTCGHCGRLGHWDPDRGAAPRLPQYVKVILAVTTSTTLVCFSYCCWYSEQHSKPR